MMERGRFQARGILSCVALSLSLVGCSAEGGKKNVPLRGTIDVPTGQTNPETFSIRLRITNTADRQVAVLNPDMGIPAPSMKWPYSQEAYQTSMLISFGYLSISVRGPEGKELPQDTIHSWGTPVLRQPLQLRPGESFDLTIPIGAFYRLEAGKAFQVVLRYGDQNQKVEAESSFTAP